MRFDIVSYEELPQSLKNTHYSSKFNFFKNSSFLLVYAEDEIIFHISDKMGAEDVAFKRNLNWIPEILQKVFKAGLSKGAEGGYDDGYDDG